MQAAVPRAPQTRIAFQERLAVVASRSLETAADVVAAAHELVEVGLPVPGTDTALRFQAFAEVAATDLSLARIFEGHADAIAILFEARAHARGGLYGVWAADTNRMTATKTDRGFRLNGRKRFCSGASGLARALVTTKDGWMFDVDVHAPGVRPVADTWNAVGMANSDSLDVSFENVDVDAPVGARGFYLQRPGFWHGAVGVAACWYGGAVGAVRMLRARLDKGLTDHQAAHVGAVYASCAVMEQMLMSAANEIDLSIGRADPEGRTRALTVRHVVEQACQEVLSRVGRAAGTSPLVFDRAHAKRAADLLVYLRQHHAESDLAELGRLT